MKSKTKTHISPQDADHRKNGDNITTNRQSSSSKQITSPREQLIRICDSYLRAKNTLHNSHELEAKFGTRSIKRIGRIDFDNVVKKLKSMGFHSPDDKGMYSLKIQPEFLDSKTGEFKNPH